MNEKLAIALNTEDMMLLKTFLTKYMLGTDKAFTALIALRHSKDMAESGQVQSLPGNEQLPPRDVEILRFFHEGFLMKPDNDEKKKTLVVQNQAQQLSQESTPVNSQEALTDPDKARRFIFEQIQHTPRVERAKLDADLIQAIDAQITREKEAGKGKMKATIPEMNAAPDVDQNIPTHEGEVVFLPKDGGRVVALGDIHGDLKTIQQVLQKEHVLEDLTAGKPVQVVFMGDLVDRGLKDVEVMEAVLALKYLFPDHVNIMKADHETAGGISSHDFPQHLVKTFGDTGGNALNTGFVQLFDQFPRMIAAANGTVFVHGGPSMVPWTLSQFAKFQGKDAETIFDNQMTWGDPIPMAINQEAEKGRQQARDELGKLLADPNKFPSESVRQQWMNIYNNFPEGIYPNIDRVVGADHFGAFSEGFIYYDERAVQAFLEKLGATNLIRAHQVSTEVMGNRPDPFGNLLYGIHTTGTGSDESHYNHRENSPRYATFDLSKAISGIDPAVNIKDVWK